MLPCGSRGPGVSDMLAWNLPSSPSGASESCKPTSTQQAKGKVNPRKLHDYLYFEIHRTCLHFLNSNSQIWIGLKPNQIICMSFILNHKVFMAKQKSHLKSWSRNTCLERRMLCPCFITSPRLWTLIWKYRRLSPQVAFHNMSSCSEIVLRSPRALVQCVSQWSRSYLSDNNKCLYYTVHATFHNDIIITMVTCNNGCQTSWHP